MTQGDEYLHECPRRVTHACRITVDPRRADVLRIEAKKVLMFNHEPFEDFLDYVPVKQLELADVYRDATAVIDALGWDPDINPPRDTFKVPLTPPTSSSSTNAAATSSTPTSTSSTDIGADNETNAVIMGDIHANRRSVEALNSVFDAYTNTITT